MIIFYNLICCANLDLKKKKVGSVHIPLAGLSPKTSRRFRLFWISGSWSPRKVETPDELPARQSDFKIQRRRLPRMLLDLMDTRLFPRP